MKCDATTRSHDEISTPLIRTFDRWWIPPSGVPVEFAYKHGNPKELSDLKTATTVLLCSSALSAITTTVGLHLVVGDGGFHPLYVLAGLFVGGLTGTIDHVVLYRGTLNSVGISELRRAGLKLPDPETTTRMPFFVRLVRVGQAAAFGFLAGTFLLIAANYSDVHSYIDSKFMNASGAAAEEVSKRVDGGITRSKQALAVQDAEIGNLTRSIQDMRSNDVKRSIGRKANAPPTASNPHLDALERRLVETIPMRDKLAAALSRQEEGRNAAIEKGINDSPNAVRKRTGLAAQLEAISALTAEHPTLLLPIALALEILSLVLELGPMWAAATKLPSALAARLARDHFVEVTEIAAEGAERLGLRTGVDREIAEPVNERAAAAVTKPPLPGTARPNTSDNFSAAPSRLNGASAARRGRGRPRNNDADQTAKELTMRDVGKPVPIVARRYGATASLDINLHKIDAPEFSKDLLLGAEEVATWMFGPLKRRRLYHLIETGRGIPTFRLGSKIAAQKSVLRAAFWAQQKRALNNDDIEPLVRLRLLLLKTREVFGGTEGDDAGAARFDRAEFRLAMNEACNVIDSFLDSA